MKYQKEEYQRFKYLLEYFVAHLEYIASDYSSSSLGYEEYIKPLVEGDSFKSSGQGYNGQAIQTQVNQWDQYQNGQICINVYGANYQSRGTYLNWQGTGNNIMADWKGNHVESLYLQYYDPDSGERLSQNVSFTIKELGLFDTQTPNDDLCSLFDEYNLMIETYRNKQHNMEVDKYIDLLKTNKNLILTGAPGTGKTFLAKEIAKAMGCADNEIGFVQFHPSYDYTDFVEGLRPKNDINGYVVFERKDGVFKEFCKLALVINPPQSSMGQDKYKELFVKLFNELVEEVKIGNLNTLATKRGLTSKMSINNQGNIVFARPTPDAKADPDIVSLNTAYNLFLKYPTSDALTNVSSKEMRQEGGGNNTYRWAVVNEIVHRIEKMEQCSITKVQLPIFVFIIDEINRGEISKIFGELFFSIDPGYRGVKGKVNTQYQNMIEDGDVFKDGFYVPDNVYIIGTMNDIDRSVESMDFAMRRRFAWQEVTAEESYQNMIENDPKFAAIKDEIRQRMFSLNKAIAETEGLDEAYQIGAAYFRKYLDYQDKENPFDCLWNNHLRGLLYEYLRGNRKAKELLEKLHKAYNKTSTDE